MHVVRSIDELKQSLAATMWRARSSGVGPKVVTGLAALDALPPGQGFALGAVHEVLSDTDTPSLLLPILLARSAIAQSGWVVWNDPRWQLNPPAVAAMGLPLDRLLILRPANAIDELWAATECLRCKGVGACIIVASHLSVPQARRIQLAAERGGGIGLLLRSAQAVTRPYAAATRWLVRPAPGEKTVQRWLVQLIHGHGGRVGQTVLLEVCRETHHVRALETVADRADRTQPAAAASA